MATGRGGTGEAYYLAAQAKQTSMLTRLCPEVGPSGLLWFLGVSGAAGSSWLSVEDGVFLFPGVCAESEP